MGERIDDRRAVLESPVNRIVDAQRIVEVAREFVQQSWFIASVTILPTMLVSIPFGAVIALELGTLARQIGAQSLTGAASVLAIIREASPIVCALLIAGAGGSAICADLGSRKIRDESG